jgi:predicted AAA+ superfamily ATPase
MIKRQIIERIQTMATKMPIISITGPRQSGKTTLAKMCFPNYDYVNLENPDVLGEASTDPRLFLNRFKDGLIIDEVQKLPKLFSYIQTISDEHNKTGEYILTGSQNFLLSANISQSLAGRVFITNLLPFSLSELKNAEIELIDYNKFIYSGFYPRLYDKQIEPNLFYPSYIQTYVERDVRQIINISNLHLFQKFMRLAAGRIGQILNYNNMANDLSVDLKTVKSWFSILETSFIVFRLQPHYQNFSKRVLKTPKLYFYDTGLACSLLGIKRQSDLEEHWSKGSLFENMIIVDIIKNYYNKAENPPLYYWRDNTGNEIDCIVDNVNELKSIEIKSSTTLSPDFFKSLRYYGVLNSKALPFLVYGGKDTYERKEAYVTSWNNTEIL